MKGLDKQISFNNMMEKNGYEQKLLEGSFHDNPSVLKFWHVVTFLSYYCLPVYSELEIIKTGNNLKANALVSSETKFYKPDK